MKQILQRFSARRLLSLMFLLAMVGNAWGDTYTITFKTNTSDGSTEIGTSTKTSTVISSGTDYVSGFTSSCSKAYYASTSGVKLGTSKAAGTLEFNIATTYQSNIKKITVKSAKYSSDTGTLTLYNGSTSLKTGITPGTDYVHTFDNPTTVSSIKITTSSKRAYVSEIILETAPTKALSSIAVSGTPTKTTYEAGEALNPAGLVVTGTYSDDSQATIAEGISWTFDPATLTAGTTSCTATAKVGEISSSAYNVTGLTVNAGKTLIGIEATGTPAEFWKGDTFNHNGITVTATWDDESETDVTSECSFSSPDMATAGEKTVTVTYRGETDTYNIDVKTIENTQATAYTITEAVAKYNAGKDLTSQVYVKGTVSKITTAWNSTYNNITYSISEDGKTTSTQFTLYRCVTNGAAVGDDVVAHGTLGINSSVVQLAAGNSIVASTKATTLSIANISVAMGEDITPVVTTNIVGEYAIEYTSSDADIVYADGDEMITATKTGTATITATIVADGYKTATTTFTVTVTSNATLSSIAISGDLTKSTYTVGDDFDFSGLTATGTYSDATTADLTSTVTWTVEPTTLTATTTSVTVKATSGAISGTKAYDITVNKKTPTITVANMTIGKTDANVAISAETTPEEAELTYSIVSGSEYVTLSEGKLTAVAPGTATLKASYVGNDDYAPAETTFTVTVESYNIATKNGFTTGDNSGSHNFTDNTDISFEAFKGNAGTAPAIPSNTTYLRLYQNGGYITISGIKGVKIQSVTLTTGSTYDETSVGYCVDDNDAPTTGTTVAKSSTHTISSLNNQSVSIYCLATDSKKRLDIASLSVKYTKEEVTLSSIALSGTYQTEFIQNSTFNHDNAVVTATYSDGDTQDVTSSAVFTTPDLTTTGEKTVTVSYTHGGATKETTYNINVTAETVTSIALSGTFTKVFKTTDDFNHTGAVVTATYNSGRNAVVEDAEFSTPDLSTTGTKTVTVTYAEKQATYDIKVIPATAIFYESFDTNDGTGANDGYWSGSIAADNIKSDNANWTFANAKGAKECAKFGTGSAAGSAKTPAITLTGTAKITFKAAAWNGNSEETTLNLTATSGTLSQTSIEMAKGAWTEYTVYLTGVEESTQITFAASQASNNRFFLDEVLVEQAYSRATASDKYGTICLPYNATVTGATVYTAEIEDGRVKLTEAGTSLTAGTPYIYKATADNQYFAYSGTPAAAPTTNGCLTGIFTDTELPVGSYVMQTQGEVQQFYKVTENNQPTLSANKAYIAASAITSGVKAFAIGDEATAISQLTAQGSQLNDGKFIVNGRIVIIKNGAKYSTSGVRLQ